MAEAGGPPAESGSLTGREGSHSSVVNATTPALEAPLSPGHSSATAVNLSQPPVFAAVNAPPPSIDSTLPAIDKSMPTFDDTLPLSETTAPIPEPVPAGGVFSNTAENLGAGDGKLAKNGPADQAVSQRLAKPASSSKGTCEFLQKPIR